MIGRATLPEPEEWIWTWAINNFLSHLENSTEGRIWVLVSQRPFTEKGFGADLPGFEPGSEAPEASVLSATL